MLVGESDSRLVLEAMDRIMAHPIMSCFEIPHRSNLDGLSDGASYSAVLARIRRRIQSGFYASVQEWSDDLESIWSSFNASYHSEVESSLLDARMLPFFMVASAEARRLFAKERARLERRTVSSWCRQVFRARTQITELLALPPRRTRPFAPSTGTLRSFAQASGTLTDRELFRFLQVSHEVLTSEHDQREMAKIVTAEHPELETGSAELHIDVTRLSPRTVSALREYMRGALARQGKQDPD
jgi:hypothetical protein